MDIGMIVIQVTNGKPLVARYEETRHGEQPVPAANAAALASEAARVVAGFGATLNNEGVYLCTDQLQAAAEFPPLPLPADVITLGEAGSAPTAVRREPATSGALFDQEPYDGTDRRVGRAAGGG